MLVNLFNSLFYLSRVVGLLIAYGWGAKLVKLSCSSLAMFKNKPQFRTWMGRSRSRLKFYEVLIQHRLWKSRARLSPLRSRTIRGFPIFTALIGDLVKRAPISYRILCDSTEVLMSVLSDFAGGATLWSLFFRLLTAPNTQILSCEVSISTSTRARD